MRADVVRRDRAECRVLFDCFERAWLTLVVRGLDVGWHRIKKGVVLAAGRARIVTNSEVVPR